MIEKMEDERRRRACKGAIGGKGESGVLSSIIEMRDHMKLGESDYFTFAQCSFFLLSFFCHFLSYGLHIILLSVGIFLPVSIESRTVINVSHSFLHNFFLLVGKHEFAQFTVYSEFRAQASCELQSKFESTKFSSCLLQLNNELSFPNTWKKSIELQQILYFNTPGSFLPLASIFLLSEDRFFLFARFKKNKLERFLAASDKKLLK